jgi:hypothetical protein
LEILPSQKVVPQGFWDMGNNFGKKKKYGVIVVICTYKKKKKKKRSGANSGLVATQE